MRTIGSSNGDILTINSRVVSEKNKLSEEQIPNDAVYATATNKDKVLINEGIFAKHISKTHKQNIKSRPPLHTICIKASHLLFQTKKRGAFNRHVCDGMEKDLIYSSCSDADVEDNDNKRWDPMLKLYYKSGRKYLGHTNSLLLSQTSYGRNFSPSCRPPFVLVMK